MSSGNSASAISRSMKCCTPSNCSRRKSNRRCKARSRRTVGQCIDSSQPMFGGVCSQSDGEEDGHITMAQADIAHRVYDHTWKLDPIVRSLLDTDFYKLLMLQMIWGLHPD